MPKFRITYTVYADLQLDQHVIDAVDDEWRSSFYNLHTPEDIAKHIGRNLIRNARLSMLDGWADQADTSASLAISNEEVEAEAHDAE